MRRSHAILPGKVVAVNIPWYLRLRRMPLRGAALVSGMLALAYWITYRLGGTSTALPHVFYVPIVFAAFVYGHLGGLAAGIAAGVFCGPLMPNMTATGLPQTWVNWLLRTFFFAGIGMLTGGLANSLCQRLAALRTHNIETFLAFVRAIDAKDPYTAGHSLRVAEYAGAIATALNLPPERVDRVRWAALLHDVGKIAVPGSVLRKAGRLTPQEWEQIRAHPIRSVEIVSGISSCKELLPGIRQHHERIDGQGYPDGLKGDAISLEARIIAVADAFEAMTSRRPYRDAIEPAAAVRRIQEAAGTQFDPHVVQAFVKAFSEHPERFRPHVTSPERPFSAGSAL